MKARMWAAGLGIYVALYVVGAGVWFYFAFFNPSMVPGAADTSFVPFVPWFFHTFVAAAPAVWSVAVALGELMLAAMLVTKRFRVPGLLLATVWQVFVAGVADGWPLGALNLLIAAGQVGLLLHYWHRPASRVARVARVAG